MPVSFLILKKGRLEALILHDSHNQIHSFSDKSKIGARGSNAQTKARVLESTNSSKAASEESIPSRP